jgi:hypothetical protein
MKKLILSLLLIFITACNSLFAQDTLPKFSVKNVGSNRIIVSWTNNFQNIRQISIQRSFDSLANYKTILTVPDPTTPQNGYLDTKATNDHMFYRIYIMLEHGIYMFSSAKKPVLDTTQNWATILERLDKFAPVDSIKNLMNNTTGYKPPSFVPSLYVYTYKDGYVRINLPDEENKKYGIKFFEEDGTFLFELKDVKEKTFKIDKTNFYHAGWFKFELYENGKLMEKNKFYLEKDF